VALTLSQKRKYSVLTTCAVGAAGMIFSDTVITTEFVILCWYNIVLVVNILFNTIFQWIPTFMFAIINLQTVAVTDCIDKQSSIVIVMTCFVIRCSIQFTTFRTIYIGVYRDWIGLNLHDI